MKWKIKHLTRYEYASPVRDSFNDVRVSPIGNEHQIVKSFFLRILPATRLQKYNDFYGNTVHHFEIPENHSTLNIESDAIVETKPPPLLADDALVAPANKTTKKPSCFDFLQASQFVDIKPEIWRLALDATRRQWPICGNVRSAIMRFVHTTLGLSAELHPRPHAHARSVREGQGSLPGFRARHPRPLPLASKFPRATSAAISPPKPPAPPTPGSKSSFPEWAGAPGPTTTAKPTAPTSARQRAATTATSLRYPATTKAPSNAKCR